MPRRTLTLPYRGAANGSPFISQPGDTAPPDGILNVVPRRSSDDRVVLAKRYGAKRLFPNPLKDRPVQALLSLTRASQIVGYLRGDCRDVGAATSHPSGLVEGQAWILDDVPSLALLVNIDTTADPFNASDQADCVACAANPGVNEASARFAVAYNIPKAASVSGNDEVGIAVLDENGTVRWSRRVSEFSRDVRANRLLFLRTNSYLALLTNDGLRLFAGRGYTDPFSGGVFIPPGTLLRQFVGPESMNRWSSNVVCADSWADAGGQEFLFVGFDGATGEGTFLLSGTPTGITTSPDEYARQFRAGIMRLSVGTAVDGWLNQVGYGTGLAPGADFFEAEHGYWRASEHSRSAPRGCRITDLRCLSDGSVVFTRTNQGAGPTNSWEPDGTTPFYTLAKIGPNGVLAWEKVTDVLLEVGFGGFINDIPIAADDYPTLSAVSSDDADNVYCGGRAADSNQSFFKINGRTGEIIWSVVLADRLSSPPGSVLSIDVDPRTNRPFAAGHSTAAWAGSGGEAAHLWELEPGSGSVLTATQIHHPSTPDADAADVACGPGELRILATEDIP